MVAVSCPWVGLQLRLESSGVLRCRAQWQFPARILRLLAVLVASLPMGHAVSSEPLVHANIISNAQCGAHAFNCDSWRGQTHKKLVHGSNLIQVKLSPVKNGSLDLQDVDGDAAASTVFAENPVGGASHSRIALHSRGVVDTAQSKVTLSQSFAEGAAMVLSGNTRVHLIWLILPCALGGFLLTGMCLSDVSNIIERRSVMRRSTSETLPIGTKEHLSAGVVAWSLPSRSRSNSKDAALDSKNDPIDAMNSQICPGLGNEFPLCPELVVPENCECVFVLPIQPQTLGSVDVTDESGRLVLQAVIDITSRFFVHALARQGQYLIVADCRATPSPQREMECSIHRASGEFYGLLSKEAFPGEYVLSTRGGAKFRIEGSPEDRAFKIFDSSDRKLAETRQRPDDSIGTSCTLHMAPLVDAGLMFCALFRILLWPEGPPGAFKREVL